MNEICQKHFQLNETKLKALAYMSHFIKNYHVLKVCWLCAWTVLIRYHFVAAIKNKCGLSFRVNFCWSNLWAVHFAVKLLTCIYTKKMNEKTSFGENIHYSTKYSKNSIINFHLVVNSFEFMKCSNICVHTTFYTGQIHWIQFFNMNLLQ